MLCNKFITLNYLSVAYRKHDEYTYFGVSREMCVRNVKSRVNRGLLRDVRSIYGLGWVMSRNLEYAFLNVSLMSTIKSK